MALDKAKWSYTRAQLVELVRAATTTAIARLKKIEVLEPVPQDYAPPLTGLASSVDLIDEFTALVLSLTIAIKFSVEFKGLVPDWSKASVFLLTGSNQLSITYR